MYEVSEDDVTRAKNQFKALQLFGADSTGGVLNTHVSAAMHAPCAAEFNNIILSCKQVSSRLILAHIWRAGVAEELGRHQLAFGRHMTKAELFARVDAVDAETVKAVAERFIYDQDVAIAALGDTQNLPDYTWFRRRTYWLRY